MSATDVELANESVDLLAHLIRNQCVNDGTPESGFESRSTDVLAQYLGDSGLEIERYEARPGRENLVARIEGTDPTAPTLLLMGHTDVVPVTPESWRRDPFGGELVEDEVWGRGAVDMLNLTATMAVSMRSLARSGFRPRGTLVYLAVADEENLGTWGAEYLLERENDAVAADFVVTEAGGFQLPTARGPRLPVIVGEKGSYWCRISVRGTPGHASQPFRTDNALVTAAEIVRRLAEYRPPTIIHDVWRRFIEEVDFGPDWNARLVDEATLHDFCEELPIGLARQAHACTHTTFAPTIIRGGTKTNVIPDHIDIEVDIRTLPGQTAVDVQKMLADALGDLAGHVEVTPFDENESTSSPTDTPMWDAMGRVASKLVQGSALVPFLTVGATDARFFRRRGSVAYGFGLFSRKISFDDYASMFHGNDERVDIDSLVLSARLWELLAQDLLA
ncbi:MAG TPA: M20/M25/M40 family metallo-hydrolase [Acidimicrobiia bacterium]|jgi:acetylornithine deacetylase/succinyl-diaminopimelate desuccinylase-like protein|nr:M20/M25/M40 family metallo-hydrolase [Acidimicrobiia bacterium]